MTRILSALIRRAQQQLTLRGENLHLPLSVLMLHTDTLSLFTATEASRSYLLRSYRLRSVHSALQTAFLERGSTLTSRQSVSILGHFCTVCQVIKSGLTEEDEEEETPLQIKAELLGALLESISGQDREENARAIRSLTWIFSTPSPLRQKQQSGYQGMAEAFLARIAMHLTRSRDAPTDLRDGSTMRPNVQCDISLLRILACHASGWPSSIDYFFAWAEQDPERLSGILTELTVQQALDLFEAYTKMGVMCFDLMYALMAILMESTEGGKAELTTQQEASLSRCVQHLHLGTMAEMLCPEGVGSASRNM